MGDSAAAIDFKLVQVAALLESDPRSAARAAEEILKEHPGHPTAQLLVGTARRAIGEACATAAFTDLATTQPDSALAHLELGRTLVLEGRPDEALKPLLRATELEPGLADAWRELSAVYASAGDTKSCDEAYSQFVRLALPERHMEQAAAAIARYHFAAAETLIRARLATAPNDVVALRMLARIAHEREDYVEGERLLGECLRLAPGYTEARFDLARMLHAQQKSAPILPLVERLLALEPGNLRYRSLQASAYNMLGLNERALEIQTALLADFPNHERVWLSYGHALRLAGRSAQTIAAYRKSIELRPEFGEAWFSLANLKTFRFSAEDVSAMREQLRRDALGDDDRLHFEFALGKALEDARDFGESFAHYSRGNALRRAQVIYDHTGITDLVRRTKTLFTREFIEARAGFGCKAPDPIFILGLPRSGSTLLEQILSSHSQVEGTRELPDLAGFALELGIRDTPGKPATYPQPLARLNRRELLQLGERYLAQTRPARLRGTPFFIDKLPSNFFHVGLIHLILPNARIIDARRSPMGCCFSNFKQHYQAGVWFSYDLEDLGHFYRDYVGLMDHFDAVLPGRVHRVLYEDLVADLETGVRRLLDYCGLPFEEQCLRFHETRRIVQTASSEQVRRPLFSEGVDQWRNFEPWLGKLAQTLGDVIDRYPAARGAT
ncbi:MAG: tetratricopeptide repeat-containing sulfotransferase family protein [Steroidobacteraceae bacterium]